MRTIEAEKEIEEREKRLVQAIQKWLYKMRRAKEEAYMGRKYDKNGQNDIEQKPAKVLEGRCGGKTMGCKCSSVMEEQGR